MLKGKVDMLETWWKTAIAALAVFADQMFDLLYMVADSVQYAVVAGAAAWDKATAQAKRTKEELEDQVNGVRKEVRERWTAGRK